MSAEPKVPRPATDHPYAPDLEAERSGWYEVTGLVRTLTPEECLAPGYYRDPDWTVRDLVLTSARGWQKPRSSSSG